jgi:hypothetical protein
MGSEDDLHKVIDADSGEDDDFYAGSDSDNDNRTPTMDSEGDYAFVFDSDADERYLGNHFVPDGQ